MECPSFRAASGLSLLPGAYAFAALQSSLNSRSRLLFRTHGAAGAAGLSRLPERIARLSGLPVWMDCRSFPAVGKEDHARLSGLPIGAPVFPGRLWHRVASRSPL